MQKWFWELGFGPLGRSWLWVAARWTSMWCNCAHVSDLALLFTNRAATSKEAQKPPGKSISIAASGHDQPRYKLGKSWQQESFNKEKSWNEKKPGIKCCSISFFVLLCFLVFGVFLGILGFPDSGVCPCLNHEHHMSYQDRSTVNDYHANQKANDVHRVATLQLCDMECKKN
eukprot:1595565-Amphidinium_carterae.1